MKPENLAALVRNHVAATHAILRELDSATELARLDTAVGQLSDIELADAYPKIRRVVESCLLDASLDGYRMSESGDHDTKVAELVDNSSDALYALKTRFPLPWSAPNARLSMLVHQNRR